MSMFKLVRRIFSPGAVFYLGALCLVGAGVAGGVFEPAETAATQMPPGPQPMGPAPTAPPGKTVHPLDEPLRLLAKARQTFAGVKDYTCTLIKQERINGKLQPVNVISMMVRNQPFSVYLKWHQPRAQVGQEACYVAGKNGGNMRAKSPGLLGAVGFVSIDPNDPRARKTSNHAITEAGIANLLRRFDRRWRGEYPVNKTVVRLGEYEYAKRRCIRVETSHPEKVPGVFGCYRNVLYFDKETSLPIRVECYDWPRQGGTPGGDLLEVYSYINLRLNAGVPPSVFNK
jgi:Protein of unknown function (DUF1571)